MGLVYGEWIFENADPPAVKHIASDFESQTGLKTDYIESDDSVEIIIPLLKERLFNWEYKNGKLSTNCLIPENPYIWGNLNRIILKYGGSISDNPIAWKPSRDSQIFHKRWSDISKSQQFIIKHLAFGPWRPFDDFLYKAD
jgi:hypothetical protein